MMPGQEKLDMTSDEFDKIKEALKKEEFRKLLAEYAEELADPVKRQQYEEELQMLESQRGVDMKFIKPDPGFVIKVQDSEAKKVFLNVCSSPDIAAPEFQYKEQPGLDGNVERGQQCSLPYSLSPMHQEKDNKDVMCDVYDVVFNPEVLSRCNSVKFKDMVIKTAVEGVSTQFKVLLDKENVRYPKMKFKGTASECVIRKRVQQEEQGAFDHLPRRPNFPDLHGEEEKKTEKKSAKKEEKKKPDDEPQYKIVFRNDVDMGNFTNDRISSSRPTHVTVTISLPLHATTKDVDLDVYPDQLELHSQHYNLLLSLPYRVDSDKGKAKFDKDRQELVVSLDVVPQEIPRDAIEPLVEPSLVVELPDEEGDLANHSEDSAQPTNQSEDSNQPTNQSEDTNQPTNQSEHSISETNQSDEHIQKIITSSENTDQISEQSNVVTLTPDESDPKPSEIPVQQDVKVVSEEQPEVLSEQKPAQPEVVAPPTNNTHLTDVKILIQDPDEEGGPKTPPQTTPPKPRNRFNVSPVLCSRDDCTANQKPDHICEETFIKKDVVLPEPDIMDGFVDECGSINSAASSIHSGISSYTDATLEENLNVSIRVYQDMTTATIILDAVYNSTPVVTISGKKVWLKNEDTVLYLIVPHTITTYTIDMSDDNVCLVMYKQHANLWAALYIGHSEEEVFSYKFITEENADRLFESFGDPWMEESSCTITPHLKSTENKTEITYSINNRPCSIPIYSPDNTSDDPLIKSILKSPHSPPPMSPRSRKVSFNEEVETFVLPSMRSLKGKKRRKKKNGSNSASESSDEASSPSPTNPLQDAETMFVEPQEYTDMELPADSLKLESAENSFIKRKAGKKCKSRNAENKENVLQSSEEAVKCLDPSGALSHKMLLSNPHIYQLED